VNFLPSTRKKSHADKPVPRSDFVAHTIFPDERGMKADRLHHGCPSGTISPLLGDFALEEMRPAGSRA